MVRAGKQMVHAGGHDEHRRCRVSQVAREFRHDKGDFGGAHNVSRNLIFNSVRETSDRK